MGKLIQENIEDLNYKIENAKKAMSSMGARAAAAHLWKKEITRAIKEIKSEHSKISADNELSVACKEDYRRACKEAEEILHWCDEVISETSTIKESGWFLGFQVLAIVLSAAVAIGSAVFR